MKDNLGPRMRSVDLIIFNAPRRLSGRVVLSGDLIRDDKVRARDYAREEICNQIARELWNILSFTEGRSITGFADPSDLEVLGEVYIITASDYLYLLNQIAMLRKAIEEAA